MSVVVTGATGHLGRLAVESLLAKGVPAGDIVAGGRSVEKLADLAERGVRTARIDYDDPATLAEAFKGADKVLLVSGTDFGRRVEQHTAAARAAQEAGASVIYTSAPYADTTSLQLAVEHRGTEEAIRALGVPFTFLRNSWYFENYTPQIPTYLEHGAVLGSAGDGRVSGAPRAEYAEAAAVVLTSEGHEGKVYELGGDASFTLADLAASVAKHSGKEVVYSELPVEGLAKVLEGAGLPAPVAAMLADTDRSIRAGELEVTTGDLSRLIGRPTGTLDDAVAAALA
ncbi:MAG: SDR family oxidoreductase [Actinobacteria bacterium]|nr:SDR family oxidoreductase [Actinomycetota bacterium]